MYYKGPTKTSTYPILAPGKLIRDDPNGKYADVFPIMLKADSLPLGDMTMKMEIWLPASWWGHLYKGEVDSRSRYLFATETATWCQPAGVSHT